MKDILAAYMIGVSAVIVLTGVGIGIEKHNEQQSEISATVSDTVQ
jgi:hypothetical protein